MSVVSVALALVLLAGAAALLLWWMGQRHADVRSTATGASAVGQQSARRGSDTEEDNALDSDDAGEALGRGRGRAVVADGLRRRRPQHTHQRGDGDDDVDENGKKLTRLQRKRLAKEREREERRQAQDAAVEARRQRVDADELRHAEAVLRDEECQAMEEAALQQLRAEKKVADDEEYAKWVSSMGVEERGELGDEARERQTRVRAFVLDRAARVQARAQRASASTTRDAAAAATVAAEEDVLHVLVLQAAARDLTVSVEELVGTIERLAQDGAVHGVFDDRGKFIFLAPEQLPQLAHFLRVRGRVSVQEFTRECNRVLTQA